MVGFTLVVFRRFDGFDADAFDDSRAADVMGQLFG